MKWGVWNEETRRRYQGGSSSSPIRNSSKNRADKQIEKLQKKKKKLEEKNRVAEEKAKVEVQKKMAKQLKQQKNDEIKRLKEIRDREIKKAEALKSPKKAYRNRELFTREELEDAVRRFETENRLKEASNKRIQNGVTFTNNVLNGAESAVRGYNLVARLYNTVNLFSETSDRRDLPYVTAPAAPASTNKPKKPSQTK